MVRAKCEIPAGKKKQSINQQTVTIWMTPVSIYIMWSILCHIYIMLLYHMPRQRNKNLTAFRNHFLKYLPKRHYCNSAAFCFLALGKIITVAATWREQASVFKCERFVLDECGGWTHIWGRWWLWWWKEWWVLVAEVNFPSRFAQCAMILRFGLFFGRKHLWQRSSLFSALYNQSINYPKKKISRWIHDEHNHELQS